MIEIHNKLKCTPDLFESSAHKHLIFSKSWFYLKLKFKTFWCKMFHKSITLLMKTWKRIKAKKNCSGCQINSVLVRSCWIMMNWFCEMVDNQKCVKLYFQSALFSVKQTSDLPPLTCCEEDLKFLEKTYVIAYLQICIHTLVTQLPKFFWILILFCFSYFQSKPWILYDWIMNITFHIFLDFMERIGFQNSS